MRIQAALLVVGAMFGLAMGCSESSDAKPAAEKPDAQASPSASDDGGGTDSGTDAGVTPDAGDVACNQLTLDGAPVGTIETVVDDAPEAKGGVLADGTYVFAKLVVYGAMESAAAAPYMRERFVLTNGVTQNVNGQPDTDEDISTRTSKLTTSGTSITIVTTCPEGIDDESGTYSVITGDKPGLAIYLTGQGTTAGLFYEKQ